MVARELGSGLVAIGVILGLVTGSDGTAVAAEASGEPVAQEVRTVFADDLGIGAPVGIGYSGGSLVVYEEGATGTIAHRVGFDEDLLWSSLSVSGPRARLTATNPEDGFVYVLDRQGRTLGGFDATGTLRRTYRVETQEMGRPVGMVFAPSSDSTDAAGDFNLFVAGGGDTRSSGGVTEISLESSATALAVVDTAVLVRDTATSAWTPGSPDPAGVAWVSVDDQLVVVDSEVDETTGAGWNNVNLWRTTRAGSVVGIGTLWGPYAANGGYSREPTGASFDPVSNTLFVSDDSAKKIWVIKRGPDGQFGTSDDVVGSIGTTAYGSDDTEDPAFESTTGDLFFLDGVGREIYRIDPVDGVFANGNDVMTQFDISHLGPSDFEGLASAPGRGTLYVGARSTKQIFEIGLTGSLIRTISLSGITGLRYISGLEVAPSSTLSGEMHLYVVDRAIDNGANSSENDGRLFEVWAPDVGGPAANVAPVAQNDTASTAPGTAVVVDVLANDSDGNGDTLSVVGLTQPANGSATVVAGGVRYVPSSGFTGTNTFTYRASDGALESNTATVTVTVAAPNLAPTAGNDSASTLEDTSVTIAVLGNDSDPEGQPLTVQLASQPSSGSAAVNVNQTVTYTPSLNINGQVSFTYRASDGVNLSNLATVTVNATAVNDPPVAAGDAAVTGKDTAVTIPVLANDTDPDGPSLSVVGLTQPSNGSVQVVTAGVRYTPNSGYLGTASFTYRASDGALQSNVATVTVTVTNTLPAPVFRSASSAAVTKLSGSILTIAAPAGVQPGDLLLAHIRYRGATPNLTAPAGWTLLGTIPGDEAANHSVYYKIAGSAESASYQFNQNTNTGRMAGGIGAYSGVSTTNPIVAWAASASATSTLVAPDTVSTVTNAMVVRLWGWRGSSATESGVGFNVPPAGVLERWSQQVGRPYSDRNRVLAGDHVQLVTGAVGTSTASGSASTKENRRSAFTVILRPLGT